MATSVKVWQPNSQRISTPNQGVPYSGQSREMDRPEYEMRLQADLKELVQADQAKAKQVLSASVEHSPSLYATATQNPPRDCPFMILASDPMQTLFDQINWKQAGRILTLASSDLPSLQEISEAMPSQALSGFQVAYTPASSKTLGRLHPTNVRQPPRQAVNPMKDAGGNINTVPAKEVIYKRVDDLLGRLREVPISTIPCVRDAGLQMLFCVLRVVVRSRISSIAP